MVQGKKGRPTTNPKRKRITLRIDDECGQILDEYCAQENVNENEAARRGIKKLKDDLK